PDGGKDTLEKTGGLEPLLKLTTEELIDKLWQLQKQTSQEVVDQFYKDNLTQLVQNNLTNLRQARERKDYTIVITDQLWNSLDANFREALLDIHDRNETEAKKTLFDKMWQIQKEKSEKVLNRYFSPSDKAKELIEKFESILNANAWPMNIKDSLWRLLTRKERRNYLSSAKREIYKRLRWKIIYKFVRKSEILSQAKEQLFNNFLEVADGYLLTYLLNQPYILQALRNSRAQNNINILLNLIWNETIGDLKECLLDIHDRNQTNAKKALFDKMWQLQKDNSQKVVDRYLKPSNKAKELIKKYTQQLSDILREILSIQDSNQQKQRREEKLKELAEAVYNDLGDKKEDYIQKAKETIKSKYFKDANYQNLGRLKKIIILIKWQRKKSCELSEEKIKEEIITQLTKELSEVLDGYLLTYLSNNNLTTLRQARVQNNPNLLINQLWNNLPQNFREALFDIKDRNPDSAKQALFDKMWQLQKDNSQKVVDKFYKDNLVQLVQHNLTTLRQARERKDYTIVITDQLWNSLDANFREALLDIHDCNEIEAKRTLFDELNKLYAQKYNYYYQKLLIAYLPYKNEKEQAEQNLPLFKHIILDFISEKTKKRLSIRTIFVLTEAINIYLDKMRVSGQTPDLEGYLTELKEDFIYDLRSPPEFRQFIEPIFETLIEYIRNYANLNTVPINVFDQLIRDNPEKELQKEIVKGILSRIDLNSLSQSSIQTPSQTSQLPAQSQIPTQPQTSHNSENSTKLYSFNPLLVVLGLGAINSFASAHPVIFWVIAGILGLGLGIGLFFAIWRIFFPVSWYLWRLKSLNSTVRQAAAQALGQIGDKRAVESLIKALGDLNSYVRQAAAEAYIKIAGIPEAKPENRDLLNNLRVYGDIRIEENILKLDLSIVSPLIEALKQKGMTTEVMVRQAIPEARRAIEEYFSGRERAQAMQMVINMGLRLTNKGIPACSTIQYGVPLAAQLSKGNIDWFRENLDSLEEITVVLGRQGINPYETLEEGKPIIIKYGGESPEQFKKALWVSIKVPRWHKKIRDRLQHLRNKGVDVRFFPREQLRESLLKIIRFIPSLEIFEIIIDFEIMFSDYSIVIEESPVKYDEQEVFSGEIWVGTESQSSSFDRNDNEAIERTIRDYFTDQGYTVISLTWGEIRGIVLGYPSCTVDYYVSVSAIIAKSTIKFERIVKVRPITFQILDENLLSLTPEQIRTELGKIKQKIRARRDNFLENTHTSYPATLPTVNQPDRAPTEEELNKIKQAFGKGLKALTERGINIEEIVVISPSLKTPAQVRNGQLFINPNLLRGPPEQLKVIFEGHEVWHLLGLDEAQARQKTIEYLIKNNFLLIHIEFLQNNNIGLVPDKDWLGTLLRIQNQTGNSTPSSLTFSSFLKFARGTMQALAEGRLSVSYGYNIKEMIEGMRRLYEVSNQELNEKYNQHIRFVPSIEKPTERKHDFPGGLGIIEKFLEEIKDLKEQILIMVTDGGFKTRFAYKILSEGYNGLMRLPGGEFDFMREMVMGMLLSFMRLIPGAEKNFIGWAASDNFVVLGKANIGGTPLSETQKIVEKIKDASIIKGGSKIALLTEEDLKAIEEGIINQGRAFNLGGLQDVLGKERLEEILRVIEREKLKDLGMLAVDEEGKMTGVKGKMVAFLEKEKNPVRLIQLFYQYNGTLYKNPFLELVDKEFFTELYRRLHSQEAHTADIGTLDRLPVSFMQCMYQSRFVTLEEWMKIKHEKVDDRDWQNMKVIIDQVFEEFNQQGKGQIYVVDFGEGSLWVDLANLDSFNRFLNSIIENENVREALGGSLTNIDEETTYISPQVNLKIHPTSYIENTVILGEGDLEIEEGVLLSGVILEVKGKLLIPKRTKILLSDLRGVSLEFKGEDTIIDRYFIESGDALITRTNERVGTLKIQDRFTQARNILSLPFKGKKIEDLGKDAFEELKSQHPEYLSQFDFEESKDKEPIALTDRNLAGLDFNTAQKKVDYLWMYERIRKLLKELKELNTSLSSSNKPRAANSGDSYPATLPTTNQPDRTSTPEELNKIKQAFSKGLKALAERGINLEEITVISPSLQSPAEVRNGKLFINPNILRGPPEQLKIIFEGHELFHLLNPSSSEQQARQYTIQYLLDNDLLGSHIKFLKHNDIGFKSDVDWSKSLVIERLKHLRSDFSQRKFG
ncbi:MAG: HEAT repeat domain-containing protein, partial [Candidatus Njordarchaeales archaeon]